MTVVTKTAFKIQFANAACNGERLTYPSTVNAGENEGTPSPR